MKPTVLAAMAAHHGLLTRPQALDLGLSPTEIARLVSSGSWVRVRRGVYADGEVWEAADSRPERHRLRARAALSVMQRAWVLSHTSAAHELGLDVLGPDRAHDVDHVHITRPGYTGAWAKGDVKHHLAAFRPEQVGHPRGLPTLDAARTAVDVAREEGFLPGLVACDSALRRGVGRHDLERALEAMTRWPHVRRAREAVDLADAGAANPAETLGRDLVLEAGLGPVETQFPVRLPGGRIAWCDLRVGNHVIEVDGRVKYRPRAQGGHAGKDPHEVVWDQMKRQRLVCGLGLGMSRLVWEDFWGERRERAKQRLREEEAITRHRFGPDLPAHLARDAAELRARPTV